MYGVSQADHSALIDEVSPANRSRVVPAFQVDTCAQVARHFYKHVGWLVGYSRIHRCHVLRPCLLYIDVDMSVDQPGLQV